MSIHQQLGADSMEELNEGKDKQSPTPTTSTSQSVTSTFSVTPLLPRNVREICVPDESLPSSCISQLWKKPLRFTGGNSKSSSPKEQQQRRRLRSQITPSRKTNAALPPTKLFGDSEESPEVTRFVHRRSLSHPEQGPGGLSVNPKRVKLFPDETSPYEEFSANQPKTENAIGGASTTLTPAVKKLFVKSQSDPLLPPLTCTVTTALEKIESNPNLIGDSSTLHLLETIKDGKHPDLKEITGDTLAELLKKKEDSGVAFKIIDCRYPYEFVGGHISGAVNLYSKPQVRQQLLDCKTALKPISNKSGSSAVATGNLREIIIFHCEFSSRRGPSLCRYLREIDRNANAYPELFYPELYVLYGGYKDFFEKFPHLCEPRKYVPMDHPDHVSEFRKYKSFTGGIGKKLKSRI